MNDMDGGKSLLSGVSGAITTGHHTRFDQDIGDINDPLLDSGLDSGLNLGSDSMAMGLSNIESSGMDGMGMGLGSFNDQGIGNGNGNLF